MFLLLRRVGLRVPVTCLCCLFLVIIAGHLIAPVLKMISRQNKVCCSQGLLSEKPCHGSRKLFGLRVVTVQQFGGFPDVVLRKLGPTVSYEEV